MARAVTMSLLAAVGLTAGCTDLGGGRVCTESFAVATIVAVDSNGALVPDATVITTLLRTGQILTPTTVMDFMRGVYPILDDGAIPSLDFRGDSVGVHAVRGPASAAATYYFDVPGGCHIQRTSGPDTLQLR